MGGVPATVGFNAGDMVNYDTLTGSNTPKVINISSTTNVGIPGKWAFQVNNDEVIGIVYIRWEVYYAVQTQHWLACVHLKGCLL